MTISATVWSRVSLPVHRVALRNKVIRMPALSQGQQQGASELAALV
ncbi:MAG: hypothetical protein V6Z81_05165 [Parvularculales bacterium]